MISVSTDGSSLGQSIVGVAPDALTPCPSYCRRQQSAQSDEVVGRRGEGKEPADQGLAAVPQFAQPADRLHPAKALFDQFPFALAEGVPGMPGRASIDGASA